VADGLTQRRSYALVEIYKAEGRRQKKQLDFLPSSFCLLPLFTFFGGKKMPEFVLSNGDTIAVDEDGFMEDATIWNQDIALEIARSLDGITMVDEAKSDLTPEQWEVVHYLRNYYEKFGTAPMVRKILKDTGYKNKQIYELFPGGPGKGACKIAGLPKPIGCV
jgi:tRNA 2-thiouridine synthesizing protein E